DVDDLGGFGRDRLDRVRVWGVEHAGAAGEDAAAQQSVPGGVGVEAQELFAEALRVGVGDAVGDVVAHGADVGDVVVQPLQFQQAGPDQLSFDGSGYTKGVFDGQAVGEAVADCGVAADALREWHPAVCCLAFE